MIWYLLYRFVRSHLEWREYHELSGNEAYLLDALDRYWSRMPERYRRKLSRIPGPP